MLGFWLTPFLLISLAIVCVIAFKEEHAPLIISKGGTETFILGATKGYQMMDLFASLFFSGFVISQLRNSEKKNYSFIRIFLQAASIAGLLLAIVYAGLIYLGAGYSALLSDVSPERMLATIATHSMGMQGGMVACAIFALACYTTALVLTVLFADFLRKDLLKNRIPQWISLSITLTITYFVASLEFSGIAQFLGPILETTYPFLILLTLWNLGLYGWKIFSRKPQIGTIAIRETSQV